VPPTPSVSGTIVATNGGQRMADVRLSTTTTSATSTAAGTFALAGASIGERVTLSGPIVPRTTSLQQQMEVFRTEGFDLTFFRTFVRNGFEQPSVLQPVRRWTRAPMVYLKTVDEGGQPLDQVTLDTVAAAMTESAISFTGGQFGLAGVQRGTDTREGQPGWITVKFPNPQIDSCGRAQVGVEGGWIELNYLFGTRCSCGGGISRVAARTARHELGHALGFYHTDSAGDLMYGLARMTCLVDVPPSAREVEYAQYAYSRPAGNRDPDDDPIGAAAARALDVTAPIIVD
jgi:hypothetical protein